MASDPSSPVVSQERIQELREQLAHNERAHDDFREFPIRWHDPDIRDLLLALDAATAQHDAILKALPPDPRDGVDLLDRVTNLVAKVQHAERSLALVADLESARDVALARAAAAEQRAEQAERARDAEGERVDVLREMKAGYLARMDKAEAERDALTREVEALREALKKS